MKKIELRLEAQFQVWANFLYSLERLGSSQLRDQARSAIPTNLDFSPVGSGNFRFKQASGYPSI